MHFAGLQLLRVRLHSSSATQKDALLRVTTFSQVYDSSSFSTALQRSQTVG